MSALTLAQLMDIPTFVAARPRLEREVIDDKRLRRVGVGPIFTFLFENRLSCWWQVQEMCRVEQITDPRAIQHELDTYNALLPGPRELSATLLIEVPDPAEREGWIRGLVGIHQHVWLRIAGCDDIRAVFDTSQFEETRVSTVQFVRFPLNAAQLAGLADLGRAVHITVDHPRYSADTVLTPTARAALIEDLRAAGGPS